MSEGLLEQARSAHAAYDWFKALALFDEAGDVTSLSVDDLERIGDAAMWASDFDLSASVREQAFALRIAAAESRRAAGLALDLSYLHVSRNRVAVAIGWFTRAQELLTGQEPCEELARLEDWTGLGMMVGVLDGGLEGALRQFRTAALLARRVGSHGTEAMSSLHAAMVMTRTGDISGGLREIDRVMTAAVAGELDPFSTARVYCAGLSLCQAVGDLRRAREWAEEVDRCSGRPGLNDFPGDCRLHRAELTRLGGGWEVAESEVERAIPELERWDVAHVGEAQYQLGEIRRLRGELDAAVAAYARAESSGRNAQPGLALVRIAQGDPSSAVAMLTSALRESDNDPPLQGQLLSALVEAQLACGNRQAAIDASQRLAELSAQFGTVAFQAASALADCLTAEPSMAVRAGQKAMSLWRDAGAPFESALAQAALADAYRRLGEPGVARVELESARNTLMALGAAWHAALADDCLTRLADDQPLKRVRRTFVFTDIVNSTRLLAAMGDDSWASVLGWHNRLIRTQLDRFGGQEVKQRGGGDGFFAVFSKADAAISCAVAIQVEFARHRDENGFAPEVRIGVHEAEALEHSGDYAGLGVHEAARIAELAGAGQILASAPTAAGSAARGSSRHVELRGLSGTTEIVDIDWHS